VQVRFLPGPTGSVVLTEARLLVFAGSMEETTPDNPKEYVKIAGVWQHTNQAWFVDKEKMNSPATVAPSPIISFQLPFQNHQCVAHVHHWKTALEEYCIVNENWKCVRCHDEVPNAIQSMIKLYRPLKNV